MILELGTLSRRESTEDVRPVIEGETAGHRVTPISSNTNLSARTA